MSVIFVCIFFFFKQKTAYELRISDWSSDVCSSDLKILRLRPGHDIDTVIPIPDSSRDAALEVAGVLGVKYREGFIKNRYVGRTFIMPGQGQRAKSVRRKLNPIPLEFRNRVVLLVDDSIVRGTTSRQIGRATV